MAFTQEALAYAYDALEPHIDAKTMEVHYTKHHAGYTAKLNAALESHPELADKSIEWLMQNLSEVPEDIRTSVRNNGGGYYNHALFWKIMAPDAKPAHGNFLEAVNAKWGSIEAFKEEFAKAAATQFGSGWAWVAIDASGELQIVKTANQDNPLMEGMNPVMGIDVWEHAYYLNYQNRRPDYIAAWLDNVCCGDKVEEMYNAAKSM